MYVPVAQNKSAHSVTNSTINTETTWSAFKSRMNTATTWSAYKSRMEWIKQRIKRQSESEFTCSVVKNRADSLQHPISRPVDALATIPRCRPIHHGVESLKCDNLYKPSTGRGSKEAAK